MVPFFNWEKGERMNLIINGQTLEVNKSLAIEKSRKIKEYLQNHQTNTFQIEIESINIDDDQYIIKDFLNCKEFYPLYYEYLNTFCTLAKELDMPVLQQILESYKELTEKLFQSFHNDKSLVALRKLEKILLKVNKDNVQENIQKISLYQSELNDNQFFELLTDIFILSFSLQKEVLICILNNFQLLSKYQTFVIDKLYKELFNEKNQNVNSLSYLIHYMLEKKLLQKEKVMEHTNFEKFLYQFPLILDDFFNQNRQYLHQKIDIEKHKIACQRETDIDEIFDYIKKDDLESFQQKLVSNNLNINAKFEGSHYERHDLLKYKKKPRSQFGKKLSFLEYAAFFGSVNCFKYLILNKAKLKQSSLGKFAVSGNNLEIIHICEQNGCSFKNTLPITIKFHYHLITKWLIENKKDEIWPKLVSQCVIYHNYVILRYLLQNGIDLSRLFVDSLKNNNYYLANVLLKISRNQEIKEIKIILSKFI